MQTANTGAMETYQTVCIIIAIVVYLLGMIIIGWVYSKRTKNVGDFYLGGRKLGPLVTAMSAEASDMSSYLLMGIPGLAMLSGFGEAGWTAIGLSIGTYLNWLIVAKRLRNYSAEIGAITIPDFFSKRYHDKKVLTCISALIIIIFFVPYTASGFSACGKLFGTLFGVNYHTAMIISAIIIVLYTLLGGFSAASMTDLIQSIIMTAALITVLVFGVIKAGGWNEVMEHAKGLSGFLSFNHVHNAETLSAEKFGLLSIVSTLAWGLGYFGMPHILLRFMAIEKPSKIKTSRRIASIWAPISMGIAILIGFAGITLVSKGILAPLKDTETIVVDLSKFLSQYGVVAALAAGVILSGILASTMSTADSQLLAASSSVSENILGDVLNIKFKFKNAKMIIARATLVAISVIGVIIAWNPNSSVFEIVSFAWAGFGATFGPVMLLALFWKRSNKFGAIAGMVAGGAMVFIWKYLIAAKIGGILNIYELLPAFVFALIVNVIVSLLTKAPEAEIVSEFEGIKSNKEF